MTAEDIKSPLPPRRVILKPENEEVLTEPIVTTETNKPIDNFNVVAERKSKKPFIFIIAGIVLVLIILLLTVFRNKGGVSQVTLTYWGLWEEESVMNGVIADYEAKNPNVKIDYKKNLKDGYEGRLAGRLAKSGTITEDVPDIFRIHNTWIPIFRDNLAPVPKETVANIGLESDFFDVYKSDLVENGQYLSVPLMYDGLVMFYNPELLNKAQISVPNNWWTLKKSAVSVTQRDASGRIIVAGAALGLTDNVDHWSDIVGLMMKQNGVDLNKMSADNEKKLKDVLDFYTLFRTSDKVWDETLPNSTEYFASGKLAFYFGPSWRIFDIEALNPSLKFEVVAIPQLPTTASVSTEQIGAQPELTNIHWSTYWTEGVNNKSKYQKEAWKFLEYLSSAEVLEKMYQADSQIRNFGQIYPRKSMVDKISSNPKIKPFVDTADKATSWYLASETGNEGIDAEMEKYFSDAINSIIIKNQTSDEAVKTLISGINQLQIKYKLIK